MAAVTTVIAERRVGERTVILVSTSASARIRQCCEPDYGGIQGGLDPAIARGLLTMHESGTYVKLTDKGAAPSID